MSSDDSGSESNTGGCWSNKDYIEGQLASRNQPARGDGGFSSFDNDHRFPRTGFWGVIYWTFTLVAIFLFSVIPAAFISVLVKDIIGRDPDINYVFPPVMMVIAFIWVMCTRKGV